MAALSYEEKDAFVKEATMSLEHPVYMKAVAEFVDNLLRNPHVGPTHELFVLGLYKISHHAAVLARAEALGIDIEDLRV